MRASKFLSRWKQYITCVSTLSLNSLPLPLPFFKLRQQSRCPSPPRARRCCASTVDRADVVSRIGAEGVEPSSCSSRCRRR